ncbi:MAG TPA: NADH-quinone oxidoreductase subunit C [Steroidobacteraceae bacterium]|nr:NADH-quinone oxidoreductase subunit C [Steroidobacteraceae bacterium]
MPLRRWIEQSVPSPGAPGARRIEVTPDTWQACAQDVAANGGRLLALWADGAEPVTVYAAFIAGQTVLLLSLELKETAATYPSLAELFPAAARMQRAATDLVGVRARDFDQRPWLRHAAWSDDYLPLAGHVPPASWPATRTDQYRFVRVAGDGVHEIPVGPVHAGIIEPGHFRFSVVGEKVLKLEERLGYVHKGIEQRFTQLAASEGHRLAARVSGDSAVAGSWAYCQAYEGLAQATIPARAAWLRALALEAERIANHLGDLGALGNDAGFAFGLAQFSRLKEQWLRATARALGQRYLFDFVVPGGVSVNVGDGLAQLATCAAEIAVESSALRAIYDEHAGVRDRFADAGTVTPELAARLGLCGLAGRASGQAFDLRCDLPARPYDELAVRKISRCEGDVMARVAARFDELQESLRLTAEIVRRIPAGAFRAVFSPPTQAGLGLGLVEGWRGPVLVALTITADGRIQRCHPHDPSWQNWPVLEHAIIGNIVPDFPLINKSFNLSYSGHDL